MNPFMPEPGEFVGHILPSFVLWPVVEFSPILVSRWWLYGSKSTLMCWDNTPRFVWDMRVAPLIINRARSPGMNFSRQ